MHTFNVEINRGPTQNITVKTGQHMLAALAALAILEHDTRDIEIIKIWAPHLPSVPPFFFIWEDGRVAQITGADPRKW
jgi:hypothetical protein